jgi:hypothetical protein
VLSHVSAAGTETQVEYQPSGVYAFSSSGSVAIHTSGQSVATGSTTYTSRLDWFDQQTLGLTSTSSISWNNLAPDLALLLMRRQEIQDLTKLVL